MSVDIRGQIPNYTLQTGWSIDAIAGRDDAPGTSAQPIRTWREWSRRMQEALEIYGTPIDVAMVVRSVGNLAAGDVPVGTIVVGPNGSIVFTGGAGAARYTSTGSGVVVVAAVPASNTPWSIQDPSLNAASWSTYTRGAHLASPYRIRWTSGPNVGGIAWPAKPGASMTTTMCSPMAALATSAGWYGQALGAPVSGNAFVVEELPSWNTPELAWVISADESTASERVQFWDVAFGATPGNMVLLNQDGFGTQLGFYGCDMGLLYVLGGANFVGCRKAAYLVTGQEIIVGGLQAGGVGVVGAASAIFELQHHVEGGRLSVSTGAVPFLSALQVHNATGGTGGIEIEISGSANVQGILGAKKVFGLSAVTAGWRVHNGGWIYFDTSTTGLTLTGTATDANIGNPATAKLYAAWPFPDPNHNCGVVLV